MYYITNPHHLQPSEHVASLLNATVEEARLHPMDEADLQALTLYVHDSINAAFETGKPHFQMAMRLAIETAYQLGRRSRHPRDAV